MKSPSTAAVLLVFLALLLYFSGTTESKRYLLGEDWINDLKEQPVPEAIPELINENTFANDLEPQANGFIRFQKKGKGPTFANDFEPQVGLNWPRYQRQGEGRTFANDFEPQVGLNWPTYKRQGEGPTFANDFDQPQANRFKYSKQGESVVSEEGKSSTIEDAKLPEESFV